MPTSQVRIADACRVASRFLFFRATREELLRLDSKWEYAAFGIALTWIVGVGRWWDHDDTNVFQLLGLGSLVYVFALSLYLWLIIWPLRPKNWNYVRVLVCVCMTATPGLVYAIPVEWFLEPRASGHTNLGFLTFVAAWRVALLFFFIRRLGELSWPRTIVAALLPITIIANVISLNTLFSISIMRGMSGVQNLTAVQLEMEKTARTVQSIAGPAFLLLGAAYIVFVYLSIRRNAKEKRPEISREQEPTN